MKTLILILCLIGFSKIACCQDNTISLGSEVTLQLDKVADGKYAYHVISNKPMTKTIELDDTFLKDDVDSNQVKVVFGKGKFGNTPQTMLIIKSGLSKPLSYTAKIKIGNRDFEDTSVNPLFPKVKSIETWADKVTDIILGDFKIFSFN